MAALATPWPLHTSLRGLPLSRRPPALPASTSSSSSYPDRSRVRILAALGGDNSEKGKDKKKFITKEEEPEQYWQTAAEKEGKGPMSTPLPYIVIFGFSTPFIILAIAFANGWIKMPIR